MNIREDDPVDHILVGDTHDLLLFFTNRGRVLRLTSYELRADTARNTRGVPVANVIALADGEVVNTLVGVPNLEAEDLFLTLVTRKGVIKRVALARISSIRRSGLIIMNLKGKDELVTARIVREEDDVMLVTEQGMSIRFPVADIRARQRTAGGVRGMTLASKDMIVSMDVVVPDSKLLVISKKGFGKLTDLNRYRRQGRGGVGIKTLNITTKTGPVAAADVIDESTEVYVVSARAQVLRTSLSEIRNTGRATQGVKIFKPEPGDAVASIACVGEFHVAENEPGPLDSSANGNRRNGRKSGKVPPDKLA
jgi:DNA gyrase subunit A